MTHRVVIIGGGFGGLALAKALRSTNVAVTLIDRSNHHLFQPLLYQVATAGLAAPSIAAPLRHILRRHRNVRVVMGDVERIDTDARTIMFNGGSLPYDTLVVAAGATHAYFGRDDWAAHAPGLKTLEDAFEIRRRVLTAFERAELEEDPATRAAWLTFVVVGAGPTGVELAGTLAEIARHTLRNEFRHIDPATARVCLIEAGAHVLPAFNASLSDKARVQLRELGVAVMLGQPVTQIDEDGVQVGETRLPAHTVLWAAGISASPLGAQLGAPLDRAGRVLVNADLSVPRQPDVFVIGDLAAIQCDGSPVPGLAAAAKQMGLHVASMIRARADGTRSDAPFRYVDVGTMATIGRQRAVVQMRGLKLSGAIAWWMWLGAHIVFLIGFRNRVVVLVDWALAYVSYRRNARVFSPGDR